MKNLIRNVSGLTDTAKLKHLNAFAKVENGIKKLLRQKTPITFEAVAKASGVSRAFLYKYPQLRERINSLKTRNQPKNSPPINQKASEASRIAIIDALRYQIQQQQKEINILANLVGGSSLTPQQIEKYDFIAENKRLNEALEMSQNQLNESIMINQNLTESLKNLKYQNQELKKKSANYQDLQSEQSEFHQQNSNIHVLLQQTISESRQSNIKRFAQAFKQEDKSTDFLETDTNC
ncbi:hypothetical protein WA1_51420 [Scytonema hofmannii PCC 7110]|uniref:Transposase n=1 Tax=Scytonema hofmannii PCC 7110 TaxID=128403 RepID=A0A139WQ99_9CYAN|nr:DUF6262 family protein [Scytonema hofmannii]KYC34609.1 hypothetical protein WA1_51420 [Scytonema hofmannii PCC 7110]